VLRRAADVRKKNCFLFSALKHIFIDNKLMSERERVKGMIRIFKRKFKCQQALKVSTKIGKKKIKIKNVTKLRK